MVPGANHRPRPGAEGETSQVMSILRPKKTAKEKKQLLRLLRARPEAAGAETGLLNGRALSGLSLIYNRILICILCFFNGKVGIDIAFCCISTITATFYHTFGKASYPVRSTVLLPLPAVSWMSVPAMDPALLFSLSWFR